MAPASKGALLNIHYYYYASNKVQQYFSYLLPSMITLKFYSSFIIPPVFMDVKYVNKLNKDKFNTAIGEQ